MARVLPTVLIALIFLRLAWMSLRLRTGRKATVVFEGEPVDVAVELSKGGTVTGFTVSMPIADRLRFTFAPEGRLDRLAKQFGVAREWQTGDSRFDEKIFIGSEDALLLEKLSAARELRALVLEQMGVAGEIACDKGRLLLDVPPSERYQNPKLDELRPKIAQQLCPGLKKLRQQLLRVTASDWQPGRDPARRRQLILSSTAAVCGLLGVAGFFYGMHLAHFQVVDVTSRALALWTTAGIGILLLGAVMLWLRATPYTHRVLLDILLAGIPGSWFFAMAAFGGYNVNFDASAPENRQVRVEDVFTRKRKGGLSYYLTVRSWPDSRGERTVRISEAQSQFMRPGGCVLVAWHRGRLGDGWVSDYAPGRCD